MNADSPRLRLSLVGVVVLALFASLFARLWYLQVMVSDEFKLAATSNTIRTVQVQAPRGRILDRNGKVIVDNRISVQVTIDRTVLGRLDDDERAEVLTNLAAALARSGRPKTPEQLEEDLANKRYSPYVPVPVAGDIPDDLKVWIDEHSDELPGVTAERVAVRRYPYGSLAAHVIGYTGPVNKEELEERVDSPKPYTQNDEIGKYGVELVYEDALRGVPGTRLIEVDAENNPVRVVDDTLPVPGDDLVLNIDIDVQAVAEQALATGLRIARGRQPRGTDAKPVGQVGSTVILDPQTGGVLAMASFPTFNPADFVDGISNAEWDLLTDEANFAPLNNRALQGQYAPGSTFKPFTASAALQAGLITPESTIHDPGFYEVPDCSGDSCRFRNDNSKAYGPVDLRRSLTVSSDVFYYGLGAQFWIRRESLGGRESFADLLKPWSFHSNTRVDLPYEKPGRIPSPAWLSSYCEQVQCIDDSWRTGNSVNMAIGQGDVLLTPLQLASGYSTVGNGGRVWIPRVAKEVRDGVTGEVRHTIEPQEAGTIDLLPEWRQAIIDGLLGVTTREGGTAVGAFSGFPHDIFPVAAKTGTAQVKGKAPTAVFGAFGPAFAPEYAVSVMMEESGYGGSVAAPVARRLFDVLSGHAELPPAPDGGKYEELPSLSPSTGDVRD